MIGVTEKADASCTAQDDGQRFSRSNEDDEAANICNVIIVLASPPTRVDLIIFMQVTREASLRVYRALLRRRLKDKWSVVGYGREAQLMKSSMLMARSKKIWWSRAGRQRMVGTQYGLMPVVCLRGS